MQVQLNKDLTEQLHAFLNAAAGEGLVLDGVDAADLYVAVFPERYAATAATLGPNAEFTGGPPGPSGGMPGSAPTEEA